MGARKTQEKQTADIVQTSPDVRDLGNMQSEGGR